MSLALPPLVERLIVGPSLADELEVASGRRRRAIALIRLPLASKIAVKPFAGDPSTRQGRDSGRIAAKRPQIAAKHLKSRRRNPRHRNFIWSRGKASRGAATLSEIAAYYLSLR